MKGALEMPMFPDDLMCEVREAYGKHGRAESTPRGLLGVFVEVDSPLHAHAIEIAEVVFPPLENVDRKPMILSIWWSDEWDPTSKVDQCGKPIPSERDEYRISPCREAVTEFLSLADRLGAHLDSDTRQILIGQDCRACPPPCALWCLLLYRDHVSRYGPTDGGSVNHISPWVAPFMATLELAERLQSAVDASDDVRCSVDFRSVRWGRMDYSFTSNQAPVVRVLIENWRAGTPDVGDETLLVTVDPEAPPSRLGTLFREHPAWNVMIIAGGTKGTHRIAPPPG